MVAFFIFKQKVREGANTKKLPNSYCKKSHRPCAKKFVARGSWTGAGAGAPTKEQGGTRYFLVL